MLDPAIQDFLRGRKEARIKAKTKPSMTDEEKLVIEQDAAVEFAAENWITNAAKRAKQLYLVSHPGKFSHPSAKISSIISIYEFKPDGFVRTGNASSELDVFGNAASLDVHKFLMIALQDGKTLLDHLEQSTPEIEKQLAFETSRYSELRAGFMAIKNDDSLAKTHERIKQVYFPVENGYHLLSILSPSGLIFKLKERIDEIRFSDQTKIAREARRKGASSETGFAELYDLHMIGFGGTKPQNISVLNSQNGGKSYLLQSLPPSIQNVTVRPPKSNFFSESLNPWSYRDVFQSFHKLISSDYNNINIRVARDRMIQFIVAQIIERMWTIRQLRGGWSDEENSQSLPEFQKIWLDQGRIHQRESHDDWLDKVENEMARWFLRAYRKLLGNRSINLGDDELAHVRRIIEQNKEGLR